MQTKIMNEGWACATKDALLLTENGFVYFDQLYEAGEKIRVAAGGQGCVYPITDFHKEEKVPTIRIRTRRGLTIEGASKHRLLMTDGRWEYLRDVKVGEKVVIENGTNIWPEQEQRLGFAESRPDVTLDDVAAIAGVSISTVIRHIRRRRTRNTAHISKALQT